MFQSVRARYTDGVLEPLDVLELEDGTEVIVSITQRHISEADIKASMSTAGTWNGKVDAEKLIREIYDARLTPSRPLPELKSE